MQTPDYEMKQQAYSNAEEDLQAVINRQAVELGVLADLLNRERKSRHVPGASALRDLQKANWDLSAANDELVRKFESLKEIQVGIISTLFNHSVSRSWLIKVVREAKLLDLDWYKKTYTDVAQAGHDPVEHFVEFGFYEGRSPPAAFEFLRKV